MPKPWKDVRNTFWWFVQYVDDYLSGKIKSNELTRKYRWRRPDGPCPIQSANIEPCILLPGRRRNQPDCSKRSSRTCWIRFCGPRRLSDIIFARIPFQDIVRMKFCLRSGFFMADGHHRQPQPHWWEPNEKPGNPHHTENENTNFMAVVFPQSHL